MSKLKKLITEIHHRSLWQVLLIYVGAGWTCFELIDAVTNRLGQKSTSVAIAQTRLHPLWGGLYIDVMVTVSISLVFLNYGGEGLVRNTGNTQETANCRPSVLPRVRFATA